MGKRYLEISLFFKVDYTVKCKYKLGIEVLFKNKIILKGNPEQLL
jgi:hypothetical protein